MGRDAIVPGMQPVHPIKHRLVLLGTTVLKALPSDERWITVHPNGPGDRGTPILLQVQKDGSAKVIGGAGGTLNHLRLTGVKSEAQYRSEAAEKDRKYREKRKAQRDADKARGIADSKDAAARNVRQQVREHEAAFIKDVGAAMGWSPAEMSLPDSALRGLTDADAAKVARQHHDMLLRRAKEAVKQQRRRLVLDSELRTQAGIGELPLQDNSPETLSVQDLDPVSPHGAGLGFSTDYRARAERNGLDANALAEELAEVRKSDPRPVSPQSLKAASALLRETPPPLDGGWSMDAKKAVDLLRAEKALRSAQASGRGRLREIGAADAPVEPRAFVVEAQPADGAAVAREVEQDIRTVRTRAFLDEVGKIDGGADSLGRHIGVGAYGALNSVALAATGASQLDRSVVDVLGISGAAQVLAQRLHRDLPAPDVVAAQEAMERYHVDRYMGLSESAMKEANELLDTATEIELGEPETAADLAAAKELNARRADLVGRAERTLGNAYGEMEANAAMVMALKQGHKDQLQIPLGRASLEHAIVQLHAIGLERGDYVLGKEGASTILTLKAPGIERLTQAVSPDDLAHVRGALDIIEGRADEDGWLPHGVADRPDMAMESKPGILPRLAIPYPTPEQDTSVQAQEDAVRAFIGSRIADGDTPAKAVADLLSENTMRAVGDRKAFMEAVRRQAPLYGPDGQVIRAEDHRAAFEAMADEYVHNLGGSRTPLQRQNFAVDKTAVDALHRALAEHPDAVAAFKPIGELSNDDQRALRQVFAREFARSDPAVQGLRDDLAKLDAEQPAREVQDMFGTGENPAWRDWRASRDEAAAKLERATMSWGKYVSAMGSSENAYAAMQDVVRSGALRAFADHYNRLNPEGALRVGRTVISHDLRHLDALDPEARERRLAEHRQLVDSLRERHQGRYAAGDVAGRMDAARAADEGRREAQMAFFGDDGTAPSPGADGGTEAGPELGQRWSIGHAAEQTVAQMMPIVGSQFRPGQPIKLWRPDMSGRFVGRQRAVKLIEHNKRVMAALGVGSGKTSIGLSGFTHLQGQGKAKRGLFLVPSIVQGQFHGEALTLLQPGKFKWHADPLASREERIAAYKDPDTHFSVVTHQAFRDDMLHLAAAHEGSAPAEVAKKLAGMSPDGRQEYMRDLLDREGIHHDYLNVDEGHNLLNRSGKENSSLANVVDAVADGTPYYVNMTADPIKNDASEAYDVLAKMDRARYHDREAFMRKYGVDTPAAREGLRREMARHFYPGRIASGVNAVKTEVKVPLGVEEHRRLRDLDAAAGKARIARMKGGTDIAALRTLSPLSFKDAPEADHEAIAQRLNPSIGMLHNNAVLQTVSGPSKTSHVMRIAEERRGRPGVVFSRSLDRVGEIAQRLKSEGHRVVTLTGADSSADKDRKKREYQSGKHDIMVASDAAAVGANLQRGKWLVQYDTPQTAMLHAQRDGRINRIGQMEDVELMDLVADHPAERRERKRLAEKYRLREIVTSPLEGLDDTGLAAYLHAARVQEKDMTESTGKEAA